MEIKNMVDYYGTELFTVLKSFMKQAVDFFLIVGVWRVPSLLRIQKSGQPSSTLKQKLNLNRCPA